MRRIQFWLLMITLSFFLAACSSSTKDLAEKPPSELYNTAQEKLQSGNFRGAITQLEALDNRYPFGPYAQQVQLDLIYAYYKSADYPLAIATIDRFIKLNPTHPNIDYVFYMRGLVDMALDSSLLQDVFGIDRFDRDPQYAMAAFNDFNQLINNYPNSQYDADAQKRMIAIKNRLARFQLSIAQYYTRRGAYVAVVNRVERMLEEFPDCQATHQGLPLLENAYKQLRLPQQAQKVASIIAANKQKGA